MVKIFSLLLVFLLLISGCGNQQGTDKQIKKETPPATSTDTVKSEAETETVTTEDEKTEDATTEVVDDGNTNEPSEPNEKEGDQKNSPPAKDDGDGQFKEPDPSKESKDMTPSITYQQNKKTVLFTFNVKNNLDQMFTYHFETSQQFDYQIKNSEGKIIRGFTKEKKSPVVPSKYPVKPGGTASFEVTVEDLAPGSYVVDFVLTAKEMQQTATLKFEVK